jgi:hypothetical protein
MIKLNNPDDCKKRSDERKENYMYLANTTIWSQFLLITYIIKIKRANPVKMDLP